MVFAYETDIGKDVIKWYSTIAPTQQNTYVALGSLVSVAFIYFVIDLGIRMWNSPGERSVENVLKQSSSFLTNGQPQNMVYVVLSALAVATLFNDYWNRLLPELPLLSDNAKDDATMKIGVPSLIALGLLWIGSDRLRSAGSLAL